MWQRVICGLIERLVPEPDMSPYRERVLQAVAADIGAYDRASTPYEKARIHRRRWASARLLEAYGRHHHAFDLEWHP